MTRGSSQHPSVVALLRSVGVTDDAEEAIRQRARGLVSDVLETLGWEGPPFDPRAIASFRGFKVRAAYDGFKAKQDACITPGLIVVNARKPPRRQRYSVAHEVIHTLFPDYEEGLRRAGALWRQEDDDSEVERLCQIGASELLFPAFAFAPRLAKRGLSLGTVIALHEEFDASLEATARRTVELTDERTMVLFLRPVIGDRTAQRLRFADSRSDDYRPHLPLAVSLACLGGKCRDIEIPLGTLVPKTSVVTKAWKRAGYPPLAADVYSADEAWPVLPSGEACMCEAMVLPKRSAAPHEVLCLIRLGGSVPASPGPV